MREVRGTETPPCVGSCPWCPTETQATDTPRCLELVQTYLEALRRRQAPETVAGGAWDCFYRTYRLEVVRLARRYCRSGFDVEDCVQEAWQRIASKLGGFRRTPGGGFAAWLRVLVRHARIDQRRRRRPLAVLTSEAAARLAGREEDPAVACERHETVDRVRGKLDQLRTRVSPESFQVLYLHAIAECPVVEVAARVGLSEAQAWSRYHRMVRLVHEFWVRPEAVPAPSHMALAGPPARISGFSQEFA